MPRPHQKGHKHSRRSHASPQTRSPPLGDIHFYLPGAPTKVYPLYKGELWVVLWHLWMPSAFDSEALQGYRATLVEPALRDLASKKRIADGDKAAFNRFYGDLLYTEGRYEEALVTYLKADRGDHTDARVWHGVQARRGNQSSL